MKQHLNGIYWKSNSFKFELPYIGDTLKSCCIFRKNIVEITWNSMRSLENNPTTLPQTATILSGQSVGGISIFDLMQVKNYADGAKLLLALLQQKKFDLSTSTACAIHKFVGKEDALEWGVIRNKDVSLHNISFVPPTQNLSRIIEDGLKYLKTEIHNPVERAIGVFLFLARNQPFYDANKRTASLMMNGSLMNDGYFPITVLNKNSEQFHEKLGQFYESGNANSMFEFFSMTINELYTKKQRTDFQKRDPEK
ncbi:Fic family protein [uncultured Parasutterella sp.]|uniref:Fic family protein n=1 Tax=uncultured Parasutterella sp. TaxID=1263098 RepID=UPI0027297842|nr:Fic family protein [uncultured Parasutterella sp.]